VSEANGLVSLLVDNVAAAKLERAHGWIVAALGDYTATMSLVNGWEIHGWNERIALGDGTNSLEMARNGP
jgi:hypothetical protein